MLVGSGIVATRSIVDDAGPASIAFLRYAIGLACLAGPVLLGRRRVAVRDLGPIALLGVGQFGLLIVLLNHGLRTVPAARGALLFATTPLLTMLLAAALRLERLTAIKAAGVALGEKVLAPGAGGLVGELAVVGSALVGAVCSVFYRPYLRRYPVLPVGALAMLASVCCLALAAAGEGFFAAPPRFTPAGWAAVLFIGVNSGVGYYLWLWALGHAPPTRVTVFLSLSPVTAAVLGALLLGEATTATFLAGVALVAGGLVLVTRSS